MEDRRYTLRPGMRQLQDGQAQGFIIEQLQQQATEVGLCICVFVNRLLGCGCGYSCRMLSLWLWFAGLRLCAVAVRQGDKHTPVCVV